MSTINEKQSELDAIKTYVKTHNFIYHIDRFQLQALWTAFCLHHNCAVDTYEYDKILYEIYDIMSENPNTATVYANYDVFGNFMAAYLT